MIDTNAAEMETKRLAVYATVSVLAGVLGYLGTETFASGSAPATVAGLTFLAGLIASSLYATAAFGRVLTYINTRKYHDETR